MQHGLDVMEIEERPAARRFQLRYVRSEPKVLNDAQIVTTSANGPRDCLAETTQPVD
jgi:hypothetical protein